MLGFVRNTVPNIFCVCSDLKESEHFPRYSTRLLLLSNFNRPQTRTKLLGKAVANLHIIQMKTKACRSLSQWQRCNGNNKIPLNFPKLCALNVKCHFLTLRKKNCCCNCSCSDVSAISLLFPFLFLSSL